jgi:2-oxoglutarate ferredoxin oxidoreductase subunit alpha
MAREFGIKAGMMRLKTIWPFADKEIKSFTSRVKCWIVPELNMGQIAHEVEWAVAGQVPIFRINRVDGEPINPVEILDKIKELSDVQL